MFRKETSNRFILVEKTDTMHCHVSVDAIQRVKLSTCEKGLSVKIIAFAGGSHTKLKDHCLESELAMDALEVLGLENPFADRADEPAMA